MNATCRGACGLGGKARGDENVVGDGEMTALAAAALNAPCVSSLIF